MLKPSEVQHRIFHLKNTISRLRRSYENRYDWNIIGKKIDDYALEQCIVELKDLEDALDAWQRGNGKKAKVA